MTGSMPRRGFSSPSCSRLPRFAPGRSAPNGDIAVKVRKDGPTVAVDVDLSGQRAVGRRVGSPDRLPEHAAVHFEHPVQRDRGASGDTLHVRQKGKASRGPLSVTFDLLREVKLVPQTEIQSRLISGDLKGSDSSPRIVREADGVHILNSGRYTPKVWVPPIIGPAVIEAETQKQFGEFRTEILRRSAMLRPQT